MFIRVAVGAQPHFYSKPFHLRVGLRPDRYAVNGNY
jgi:hypothetical protein